MDKNKESLLRKILAYPNKGLFSPADLFNGIGDGKNEKEINELISEGFIHEIPHTIHFGKTITFYRLSEKGRVFASIFYKKIWYLTKSDLKTIIITVIISIITTIITLKMNDLLK